jgi:membrane protein implicated in regulation of membrane protease activity
MDDWVIWLLVGVALGVGEVLTLSFFLGPFAIGALVAALLSAAGVGPVVAGVAFLVVSTLALLTLRPVARRHVRTPAALRTNTAALVGRTGTVIDRVSDGEGSVKLDGEVWTARPYDDDAVIEPGRRVHVMEIRGATALVAE